MFISVLKFLQLTDADQDLYKNFPLVISERWQAEVAETVFETINQEADKMEQKKKAKQKLKFDTDEKGEFLCINILYENVLVINVRGKNIQIMQK